MRDKQSVIIERFKNAMINELDNNDRKGDILSWKGIRDKIIDLEYHKAKMLLAIKQENSFAVREYIADCANILMSIGNEIGVYEYDSEDNSMESVLLKPCIEIRPLSDTETFSFIPNHLDRYRLNNGALSK